MKIDKINTSFTLIVPPSGIYVEMDFIDQYCRGQRISRECIKHADNTHLLMYIKFDECAGRVISGLRSRGRNIYKGDF